MADIVSPVVVSMRRAGAGPALALVAGSALASGCGSGDCMKDPSYVSVTLPPGWTLTRYCLDDECLAEGQLVAGADFNAVRIDVRDRPDTYRYRVEMTTADGRRLAHDGEIKTVRPYKGDYCQSRSAHGQLNVVPDGRLTTGFQVTPLSPRPTVIADP
jgi:hypothetical protein